VIISVTYENDVYVVFVYGKSGLLVVSHFPTASLFLGFLSAKLIFLN